MKLIINNNTFVEFAQKYGHEPKNTLTGTIGVNSVYLVPIFFRKMHGILLNDEGLTLLKMNYLTSDVTAAQFYNFSDILAIEVKKGMMFYTIKLYFNTGDKITIKPPKTANRLWSEFQPQFFEKVAELQVKEVIQ